MPRILFSRHPAGHAALVVAERTAREDVSEVFLALAAVSARGTVRPRPRQILARAVRAELLGDLTIEGDPARRGADFANEEVACHDPGASAPFPVGADLARFEVADLRPALEVGREFLALVARGSSIEAIRAKAEELTRGARPLPQGPSAGAVAGEAPGASTDLEDALERAAWARGSQEELLRWFAREEDPDA